MLFLAVKNTWMGHLGASGSTVNVILSCQEYMDGASRCKWFYRNRCLASVFVVGKDATVPRPFTIGLGFSRLSNLC
ncbi:hypothetical protein KY290_000889 [Solanum tuberosum]|uniref:Uncharacterized protein n=1 Tax=Solanum tuberosum TaxID=4113 RepID=A0ABQ7WLZ6_SOLTU|nr:hypothetical protein KY290_000889 [Solanum tuberosum]